MPDRSPVKILIVEDSPVQAVTLKDLLARHGYQVEAAENGWDALNLIRSLRPELVLSDIVMPGMDGYALCERIKGDPDLREIPVVLLTSLSGVLDVAKGLQSGADSFIRKPFDERYLLSHVENLLTDKRSGHGEKGVLPPPLELNLDGYQYWIKSDRRQILDLLITTYEQAIHLNRELEAREGDLRRSYRSLKGLYAIVEGLNRTTTEREVCEEILDRTLELPHVRAGWISLRDEEGFHVAASRNLPAVLAVPGALEGDCLCRRRLLAGQLTHVTPIVECERLKKFAVGNERLRFHISIPLVRGGGTLGVMNLAGHHENLFGDEDHRIFYYGVGSLVGVALERARLYERMKRAVEERPAALQELEFVNRELEAFSYSVSHDLRAPLRAVEGFSRILVEDHAERLDDEGVDALRHVRAAVANMTQLIDDLLNLSRVTRSDLTRERVDLSALADDISAKLQASDPDRKVRFLVSRGLSEEGDSRLIRIALENLLDNAWKFTGKSPEGVIEFGRREGREGDPVFYVRDNGTGFDPAYGHKLFGPFQRLHPASEFPGTGIGLAIVQRVVLRHGGKIWAEGEVGKGAAFYFTLSPSTQTDGGKEG